MAGLCSRATVSIGESLQGGLAEADSVFLTFDGCYSHIQHMVPLRNFKSDIILFTFDTELFKEDGSIRSVFMESPCAGFLFLVVRLQQWTKGPRPPLVLSELWSSERDRVVTEGGASGCFDQNKVG